MRTSELRINVREAKPKARFFRMGDFGARKPISTTPKTTTTGRRDNFRRSIQY